MALCYLPLGSKSWYQEDDSVDKEIVSDLSDCLNGKNSRGHKEVQDVLRGLGHLVAVQEEI